MTGDLSSRSSAAVRSEGIDYVELYVGNARQAAYYWCAACGFAPVAYAGLETGLRDRCSYIVQQGDIRLILTEPLVSDSAAARHLLLHGDGVKDIAFSTDNVAQAFEETVKRGAQPVLEPTLIEDASGQMLKATVGTVGDVVHSYIERKGCDRNCYPGFQRVSGATFSHPVGLSSIDHLAFSVDGGTLVQWAEFYVEVFGFEQTHQEDVMTEYSGMNSRVVQSVGGAIKFPMTEPASGKRRSQVEEFLLANHGPGVQHIALQAGDIFGALTKLRQNGIDFIGVPHTYYDHLVERLVNADSQIDIDEVRKLGILVDQDKNGFLLQTFSKPLQGRPTLFLELVERRNARGFGGGNIRALFAALEQEQALRGNL